MLQWALKYLSLGFSVIPLAERSKTPLIKWEEFQKRRASEEEVKVWFKQWPNANVGIVTGSVSCGVVIVDLDGEEGINEAKRLRLNSTVVSITGSGKHLWFKNHVGNVQNAVRVLPGIDIRGECGYIVAPPSIHENGRRYRGLNVSIINTGVTFVNHLPLFPSELLFTVPNADKTESKDKEKGWIAKALEEMKDGNIDNTIVSILGRLRYDDYSKADARAFLSPHMERVKAESGHLEAKIENIWNRYEPKIRTESVNGYERREASSLVIHSPTNPDSLKQYEQNKMVRSDGPEQLRTGYSKLDGLLWGGLKSSRLFTVAARTGTGKTNWLIGVARTLCEAGKRVLLFSTETPYSEIWSRYIATLARPESFASHALFICDSFAPSVDKVEEAINEIKPDLFIFDHINHVAEDPRELGTFMQGLNFLRRKYECAGIISAQLNRSADWIDLKSGDKVTPRMSMIKGSGTIEQASSRVLLLSETRVTPEYTEIVGNLDKNDNGPKGLIHFALMTNPYRMVEL